MTSQTVVVILYSIPKHEILDTILNVELLMIIQTKKV